jgi:hypothetical protein
MSKRTTLRLALAIAAVSAMTLLQGCDEEDGFLVRVAWSPVGLAPSAGPAFSATGGGGGTSSGGSAVAGGTQ